jgi:hypothetical protein
MLKLGRVGWWRGEEVVSCRNLAGLLDRSSELGLSNTGTVSEYLVTFELFLRNVLPLSCSDDAEPDGIGNDIGWGAPS